MTTQTPTTQTTGCARSLSFEHVPEPMGDTCTLCGHVVRTPAPARYVLHTTAPHATRGGFLRYINCVTHRPVTGARAKALPLTLDSATTIAGNLTARGYRVRVDAV